MPPRHRKGMADAVARPNPMIPGTDRWRKTGVPGGWWMAARQQPAAPPVPVALAALSVTGLGAIDLKAAVYGSGNRLEVFFVSAHHQVVPADGSLNHAGINDVGGRGASGEGADGASLAMIEGLDVAPCQQPGQESLAASSAPGLGYDWRRDCGHYLEREQGAVAGPHSAFPAVSGDERARVVGDTHHAVRRRELVPVRCARSAAPAAHSSASASSSAVNAPWSCSNWLTAARPARMVNSFLAVSASHAL